MSRTLAKNVLSMLNYTLQSLPKTNRLEIAINRHKSTNAQDKLNKSSKCWKCGKENIDRLFCAKCDMIQRPYQNKNYFKVFEIEEKFNIDQKLLKDKFRNLQSHLHPDKFSNKSNKEQTISEEYSSLLNKAYNGLQNPLKRAEHLLELKGDSVSEQETLDDPEFLMEMMSLNEEVESCENNMESLKKLDEKNKQVLDDITKEIDRSFTEKDFKKAKKFVVKLKYYTSLSNRINNIFREKGVND